MGRRCAIRNCVSNRAGSRNTIHSFPSNNPPFRERWIQFVLLASPTDPPNLAQLDNFGVCNLHFSSEAYVASTGLDDQRLKLKRTAVPVRLPNETVSIFKAYSTSGINGDHSYAKPFERRMDELVNLEKEGMQWIIEEQEQKLKEKDEIIRKLRHKTEYLGSKCEDLKTNVHHPPEAELPLKQRLEEIFSSGQMRMLTNPDLQWIHWSVEDKAKAIALHSVSSRAYDYLRNTRNMPLPSHSTIKRSLQDIEITADTTIDAVLTILKEQLRDASPMERICGMAIDEMSIDGRFCYSPNEEQVLGGTKTVTVVTLRSLFFEWKQVIYFTFDSCISSTQLLTLIESLYAVNVEIVSLTTDMGTKNQGLWKSLNVGRFQAGKLGGTSFKHPCTNNDIFVFPDLPHLIKCLRNHTLDSGITVEDGVILDQEVFRELIRRQKSEFKLTHELTNKHLNVKYRQRQEVQPAFQLFSHKVACAIKIMRPDSTRHQKIGDVVQLINDFCDLSNTRISESSLNPFKSPFGMQLAEQDELYQKAYNLFSTMKVGRRKNYSFAPFQKGLLMFIASVRGLFERLSHAPVRCRYLMTAKLNQDLLENVFSRLRGLGQFNSNPNAFQVIHRIKRLLVSWNFKDSDHTSVEIEERSDNHPCLSILQVHREKAPVEPLSNELREKFDSVSSEIDDCTTLNMEDYTFDGFSEEGGAEYVSGFIAKKLMQKFPELTKTDCNENREAFWVGIISEGGLIEPSLYWHNLFKKFEEFFEVMHQPNSINQCRGVCAKLREVIQGQFPCIHQDIISYYVRTRTFIRIRHLNRKLEDDFFQRQGRRNRGDDEEEEENHEELSHEGQILFEELQNFPEVQLA